MKKILFALLLFPILVDAQDGILKTMIAGGVADAYTITEALPSAYDQKERFQVIFPFNNTGTATLKRAGLSIKTIKKNNGTNLSANDIIAGSVYLIAYNSSTGFYQCETCGGSSGSGTVSSVASADVSIGITNPTTTVDLSVLKAPIWSTARLLAGNSVNGSSNVAFANKFIVQGTSDSGLSGAQFLGALGTGIVKNTTTTGVLSIAVAGTDYQAAGNYITTLTGDVVASGPGSVAATLATVNSNVGTFGSATQVAQITVNGKGLGTAFTNVTITPAVGSITGLGTGVGTLLGAFSWTNFNSAITGTAPFWSLASGGTLTGANTITGTTSNIIKFSFPSLGVTLTDGAGAYFQNATAAAAGAQQQSPSITLEGQGWKTASTAASQVVKWQIYNLPIQGSAASTGNLIFQSNVNGSATGGILTLASDGAILKTFANGLQIETNSAGVGGITLNGSQPTSNQIQVTPGFQLGSGSTFNFAGTGITLNPSGSINFTSGAQIGVQIVGSFVPSSGTATFTGFDIHNTINQTSTANGSVITSLISTIYTNVLGNATDLDINTVNTSISGTHWGILSRNFVASGFGLGATTPTNALIDFAAGTTALAPIKFRSGTNLTSAVNGVVEYDGINLLFTPASTTRKTVSLNQVSRSTGQTGANASVTTWTVGANDGSFEVSANVNLTASTTNSFTVTCTYSDENNTSRTETFSFVQNGVATPIQTITNVTGVGAYASMPLHIRCKAATSITIASTGTFTSVTYNIEGRITQIN